MLNNQRFFWKIFGGYLLIIIILTLLLLTITLRVVENHYVNSLSRSLEKLNISVVPQIIPLIVNSNDEDLDNFIKETGRKLDTRLTVIGADGKVLADSENDPAEMENHGYRGEIKEALSGSRGQYIRFSKTMQRKMLYIASAIEYQGDNIAVMRSSLYLADIDTLLRELRSKIFRISAFVIGLALIGALVYSRSLVRPINMITEASRNIAAGNFKTRVLLKGSKDFESLANAFNRMSEQLNHSFTELEIQRDELRTIIASIQGGLLVLDAKGKVLLYNDGMTSIATEAIEKGKYYWEVFRDTTFLAIIEKTQKDKNGMTQELESGSNTFLCNVNYLKANSETVCVLYDITEIKNLQKVKKDFVINVSHELRTPLTAMKGFIETLEEELPQEHKHYLGIIEKHTNRLINIVNDLLVLSEAEDRPALVIEDIQLRDFRENIMRIFEPQAIEKGLVFSWSNPDNITKIRGDVFKLEQVLINLIDNAFKYTETGTVTIAVKRDRLHNIIEVSDTGIGIPVDQQSRIFERFYTVDKSRSRRLGGTGLGLSISKHIVHLHNGEIDIESLPGKGTKFIIRLPINLS
ncbi:MAG: HAMP domain-containing protein [Candidatus Marinimicrobia bacterium]|nr:HAMP domain-containing protein [Candidatus Neomarinimicrobiota bacterium]